jgi:hypothetical protein
MISLIKRPWPPLTSPVRKPVRQGRAALNGHLSPAGWSVHSWETWDDEKLCSDPDYPEGLAGTPPFYSWSASVSSHIEGFPKWPS